MAPTNLLSRSTSGRRPLLSPTHIFIRVCVSVRRENILGTEETKLDLHDSGGPQVVTRVGKWLGQPTQTAITKIPSVLYYNDREEVSQW